MKIAWRALSIISDTAYIKSWPSMCLRGIARSVSIVLAPSRARCAPLHKVLSSLVCKAVEPMLRVDLRANLVRCFLLRIIMTTCRRARVSAPNAWIIQRPADGLGL